MPEDRISPGVTSTPLFRLLNPELYIRPVCYVIWLDQLWLLRCLFVSKNFRLKSRSLIGTKMYNCSLYFPEIALFTQPPSVFLKCENVDEERLISEAEAVLDRNEALIKSTTTDQLQPSPGHRAVFVGRASIDSQRSHTQIQSAHNNSRMASVSSDSSTSSSSLSEVDHSHVDPVSTQPTSVVVASASGVGGVGASSETGVSYTTNSRPPPDPYDAFWFDPCHRLVVKAPAYDGPEVDLQGKVIVVTEATSRMSRNLVQDLARRKATLVLTSRSMDDCEDTRSRLMRWVPGTEEVHIDCRRLDLGSSRSIRRFAGALIKDYPKGIDRLLIQPPGLLSGVIAGERRLTHDAFEHQLGTSFFSFYLLTRLLLPSMSGRDRDARVVFTVDTRAAGFAEAVAEKDPITNAVRLPIDNWNWMEGYSPSAGYQRAQWALRLFADELAKRTVETGPTVVIADPLVNRTSPPPELSDEANWIAPLRWLRNIGRSYLNLGRLIVRIAPQRVTATEVMCTVATMENLGLMGVANTEAPVFQKLKRKEPLNDTVDRSEARDLLWKLGEKWTYLDTHPEPVPLPPKF
ncbi:Retinol dehydrogenase 13 [Taenia crassiceps]|uniref:Retinol dehydrogenase 13 n=1 Tax=Taenia crassiceps TaxID=6207 RepID=A0ABR4Q0F7_9CEST